MTSRSHSIRTAGRLLSLFGSSSRRASATRRCLIGNHASGSQRSFRVATASSSSASHLNGTKLALRSFSSKPPSDDDDFQEQLAELQAERDALYGFTDNDLQAWGQPNNATIAPEQLQQIETARDQRTQDMPFTHVSSDGSSVHMVDVGAKEVTRRTAKAQAKVVFPPEVMDAFFATEDGSEMQGPKGPIFSTAKLAGIMAAKKTSDLIPLCHPLPLDQVQVDVQLEGNVATIHCMCRVTHKTGVEMEALTGATAAALTIYDMVKAVSHEVRIEDTRLIEKAGGKRLVKDGAMEGQ